ncbi:MAG TPA: PqiC family protein [Spongiibacteraceae bacterium]|nr:PqiC family protein [Spongiibacteraceae bacterium]
MTLTRWLLGAIGVVLISGCIGSRSPAPNYHLLIARAQNKEAALDTSIGIGPVRIAPFLNRPNITTHAGGGALAFNDTERWGEPLEQGIQRVLLQNITILTGAETRNFPWRQSGIPQYAVRIDVTDLDKTADGNAALEVSWMLEDLKNSRVLKTEQQHLVAALNGSGVGALTNAYSDLFAQLAQRIAVALNQAQTGQNP